MSAKKAIPPDLLLNFFEFLREFSPEETIINNKTNKTNFEKNPQ